MYERLIKNRVEEALIDTPVVLVEGPRRAGKTTLVQNIQNKDRSYLSLDSQVFFRSAKSDPESFIRYNQPGNVIIDEVQRVPELFLAIKQSVDEDYQPGRFLLTGSANILAMPQLADNLAGRIEIIRMYPLTQAEIIGNTPTFLDRLFCGELSSTKESVENEDLVKLVMHGSFPELVNRKNETRRQDWASSYVETMLKRPVEEISRVESQSTFSNFAHMLSVHSGNLVNFSSMGESLGVSYKTAQRYTALLEMVYLVSLVRPWHTNEIKRISKMPKLHFLDSCVLSVLLGLSIDEILRNRSKFGPILESFVYSEILKLVTASRTRLRIYHFRDYTGREVDFVLANGSGRIAGIEVKAASTVYDRDFNGLRVLAKNCQNRFAFGAVLYDGSKRIHFDKNLAAVPISSLWE